MSSTMVQVTNVSPSATPQHMRELFSYLGDIEELKVFPEDQIDEFAALAVPSKVCFVNFKNPTSAATALHLTNSILIDRALIIARSRYSVIPDATLAMSLAAPAVALANSSTKRVGHTAPLLPTPPSMSSVLGTAVNNSVIGPASIALGAVPAMPAPTPLISLMGTVVPQPPPLTGNVDPTKIEEIRRTIYVGNLGSDMTAEQVLTFFQPCGEIKYVRMAGDETQPTRFAFVEFATPESVPIALQYNGAMFGERPIKVNHSKNAIVKPQGPSAQETKRDVDEAMKRVKEAMMDIEAKVVPGTETEIKSKDKKARSRSRSRDRRRRSRTRSRDRDRRRRSRTRSRSRDRYRRRSRSRSPGYRYSGGRGSGYHRNRYHRSRSRSPSPRRHYRSRRSRSKSPRRRDSYRKREDSRERGRGRSPPRRKSRSPSPELSLPKKSSKSSHSRKRHKSASRSPSPHDSPSERSSSRRKSKHSKKHRRHRHKSRSPSPVPSPPPEKEADDENGRGEREGSVGSRTSPLPEVRGSDSSEGVASPEREVDVDTDSSYD